MVAAKRKPKTITIVPPSFGFGGVIGTLRTLYGVRVVEIHAGYYMTPDLHVEAVRYYKRDDGYGGWVVRDVRYTDSCSDPIATKREALKEMVVWGKR